MPARTARPAAVLSALALSLGLSACTSTGGGAGTEAAPRRAQSVDAEGVVPEYCPRIALREGTAVLRKGTAPDLEYVASITQTTRECHVLNGELRMKVGVAGRVVPGPAGKTGAVQLPIRIAVTRGPEVLYTGKRVETVTIQPGAGGVPFATVDETVVVPEPAQRNLSIFVGFDEGKD